MAEAELNNVDPNLNLNVSVRKYAATAKKKKSKVEYAQRIQTLESKRDPKKKAEDNRTSSFESKALNNAERYKDEFKELPASSKK